jgi:hypothetical protein
MPDETRAGERRRGWDVVTVAERDGVPAHSYTTGLARRGLPEFILFGFSPGLAGPVLADLAQRALDGERFGANLPVEDALPGMPAMLLDVPEVEARHYLPAAHASAPKALRALQVVWPDGDDRYPWQPGYDDAFRPRQIILTPFVPRAGSRP